MSRFALSSIIAGLLLCSGCAVYTFNPKGKAEFTSIAVERFENLTSEYGLADRMTDQVIDAFISDGTFKILPAEDAEALLIGVLVRYERKPHTYDQNDQVQEYKVEMDFDISLKNSSNDSDFWKERMTQLGIYDVATETEEDAQQKVIALLIEAIINKSTRSW